MSDSFDDLLETLDQIQASRAEPGFDYSTSFDEGAGGDRASVNIDFGYGGSSEPEKSHEHDYSRDSVSSRPASVALPPPPPPVHEEHHHHHEEPSRLSVNLPPPPKSGDMSRFSRQSVLMTAPPKSSGGAGPSDCAKCGNSLYGQEYIEAGGRHYHKDHFSCAKCHTQLHSSYYDHHGQIYCQNCAGDLLPCHKCRRGITGSYLILEGRAYHKECVDRKTCASCHQHIEDTVLTALNKTWHQRCFVCYQCRRELGTQFMTKDGQPQCNDCSNKGKPTCGACHQALSGQYLSFGNTSYHDHCFVCHDCRATLGTSGFYNVKGNLKCARCAKV